MLPDRTPRTRPLRRVRGIVSVFLVVGLLLNACSTTPMVPGQDDCAIGNVTREDYRQIRAEMSQAPPIDWWEVGRLERRERYPDSGIYLRDAFANVMVFRSRDQNALPDSASGEAGGLIHSYSYLLRRGALGRVDLGCTVQVTVPVTFSAPGSNLVVWPRAPLDPARDLRCWSWDTFGSLPSSCPVLPSTTVTSREGQE